MSVEALFDVSDVHLVNSPELSSDNGVEEGTVEELTLEIEAGGENSSSGSDRRKTKDLVFPHQNDPIGHLAVDIGGTLVKLVYFEPNKEAEGGKLHFTRFATNNVEKCIEFIQENKLHLMPDGSIKRIRATGGGAYKYASLFKDQLGIELEKVDEMESLIQGLNWLLQHVEDEAYLWKNGSRINVGLLDTGDEENPLFPYLLVNIGSGVSIIRVDGPNEYKRVSGSSLGGGTFLGLCAMLTQTTRYDEMLQLTEQGDNAGVDMLVGDIYGTGYSKIGLASDTIASSFGRVGMKLKEPDAEKMLGTFRREDVAASLLKCISNNIGQLAFLNAQLNKCKRVVFAGHFISGRNGLGHIPTMAALESAVAFWSGGDMEAYFLHHDGYLGSLGSFVSTQVTIQSEETP